MKQHHHASWHLMRGLRPRRSTKASNGTSLRMEEQRTLVNEAAYAAVQQGREIYLSSRSVRSETNHG